jgi:hypothetical protein
MEDRAYSRVAYPAIKAAIPAMQTIVFVFFFRFQIFLAMKTGMYARVPVSVLCVSTVA